MPKINDDRPVEPCLFLGCDRPRAWSGHCRQHLKQRSKGKEMSPLGPWKPRGGACSVGDCGRPIKARGYCGVHYKRWQVGSSLVAPLKAVVAPRCAVVGCQGRKSSGYASDGRALCAGHMARWRKCGETGGPFPDSRACDYCGGMFERRSTALYCSDACRRSACRARHYGISPAEMRRLEMAHEDCCGICGRREQGVRGNGSPIRLAVDHDHATGAVRGLLCRGCNTGIGALQDDPDLLLAAAAYVEQHRTTEQRRSA